MTEDEMVAKYAELTRQLMEVTRERNELGERIERERKTRDLVAAKVEEKRVAAALFALIKDPDLDKQAAALGVPRWRLDQLLWNLLLRARTEFPEDAALLPRRIGPRTLTRWKEWKPVVEKYLRSNR